MAKSFLKAVRDHDAAHAPTPPAGENGHSSGLPADNIDVEQYVQAVLDNFIITPPGERNHNLNHAAWTIGRLVGGGQIDYHAAYERLVQAGHACGLDPSEVPGTVHSGLNSGERDPRPLTIKDPLWTPPPFSRSAPPTDTPGSASDEAGGASDAGSDKSPPTGQQQAYEQALLAKEVQQQRARREAKRLLDAEEALAQFREPPYCPTLTEELLMPDQPVRYAVDRILPVGGNALLTSQFKAGKTTFVNQLARALVDQQPFLDHFDVNPSGGRVALFNYEVDRNQYRNWLREVGIRDTGRVVPLNLRGYRLPVNSSHVEDWIVQWLVDREVGTWIVDPFARAFTGGISENDNAEVGRFLDTLDVIKNRAGVSELILPVHTGRAEFEEGQEHARGATRLDDWADVRWFLTTDDEGTRYFRATGRDVEVAEEKLTFCEGDRSMAFGGGDRNWEKKRRVEDAVVTAVNAEPGISLRGLRTAVRNALKGVTNDAVDMAAENAARSYRIRIERGAAGSTTHHYPTGATGSDVFQ